MKEGGGTSTPPQCRSCRLWRWGLALSLVALSLAALAVVWGAW